MPDKPPPEMSTLTREQPEIRFVGDLQKLHIGPDDRFVLTVDGRVTAEIHDRIQAVWAAFSGDGVKLLILDQGMKLGAINVKVERAA